MENFYIFGERNSGTNFVTKLVKQNLGLNPIFDQKHKLVLKEDINPNYLTICMVRNLNDWGISMYKHPYHIWNRHTWIRSEYISVYDFLNQKIKNNPDDPSPYDINLSNKHSLVEARYLKYQSYKNLENRILVSLAFLQSSDENKKIFIEAISSKYNLPKNDFDPIKIYQGGHGPKHRKTGNKYVHDIHHTLDMSLLTHYNKEIEEEINNLTFEIK